MSDAAMRSAAATDTARNIVLRASAGTGKTSVLVARLLCLLLRDGVDPDRVVAITFTEAAAAEMRSRLRRELLNAWRAASGDEVRWKLDELTVDAMLSAGPEKTMERARSALERLDRAAIETIHAFAGRLLRAHPEDSGVDPAFTVDDATATDETLRRDWAIWSREEFARNAPQRAAWTRVFADISPAAVETLGRELADFLDLPENPAALPPLAVEWLEGQILEMDGLTAKAKKDLAAVKKVRAAMEVLNRAKAGGWKPWDGDAPELEGDLSVADGIGWSEEEEELAKSGYKTAKKWAATKTAACDAVRLLGGFADYHRRRAVDAGRLSFHALLVIARDMVRDRPRVLARFRDHRFLVDEFQDTDEVQAEIVMRLASDAAPGASWRALRPRPGSVFVVGDPKQSIYGWRGADLGVYDEVTRHLVKTGALDLTLSLNFRCQPAVVEAANAVFSQAFVEERGVQAPPAPLEAARPVLSLTGRMVALRSATADPEANAAELAQAEARAIVSWIVKARTLRIEREEDGVAAQRQISFRDVAILMRSTTHLGELLRVLRQTEIPFVVTRAQHFYEAQEVRDAIHLLLALARPDDAQSLAGVLRSPIGGLTFDEIHALGRPDYRKESEGRGGELLARLRALRDRVFRVPLAEGVELALDESGLRAAAAASAHGEQALANLEKIASLAARRASSELTLSGFADLLARRLLDDEREAESPLGEPDDDVVRISTIHGAKGLEWPVVILAGLHQVRQNDREEDGVLADVAGFAARAGGALTPAWPWLTARRRRRDEAETVRLFYVACTRAREALILSRAGEKDGFFLKQVPPGVVGAQIAAQAAEAAEPPRLARPAMAPLPTQEELDMWADRRTEFEKSMKLPAIDSPSAMMHREEIDGAEAPHAWDNRAARLTGTLVHAVLERWRWGGDDLDKALERAGADLTPEDRAAILARARRLLEPFFSTDEARDIASANLLGREIPFTWPLADGRTIGGTIDLIYERDGLIHVRDYKTGGEAKKYEHQQQVYLGVVKKLFPGRDVVFRFIYLQEPAPLKS